VAYYRIDDISVNASGVGMQENSIDGSVNIYPSPASDILNVEANGAASVVLFDAMGRQVENISVENPDPGTFVLNVTGCPEGVYFLGIYSNTGMVTKKVVIAK
jgi:hypothetical protein